MNKKEYATQSDLNLFIGIVVLFLIFGFGIMMYNDYRIDELIEGQESDINEPCYIVFGERMFVVGMPKGNGDYGYYFVEPRFLGEAEVEKTKRNLIECDGTKFKELISEIETNEKSLNDVKGRVDE